MTYNYKEVKNDYKSDRIWTWNFLFSMLKASIKNSDLILKDIHSYNLLKFELWKVSDKFLFISL